jgi:glycosyltransferase involved in cell wall biosynthesis
MKVIHLLETGDIGGIERLCYAYQRHSAQDNLYVFTQSGGALCDQIQSIGGKVLVIGSSKPWPVIKALLKLCKAMRPDVLIVHKELLKLHAFVALARLFGLCGCVVVFAHGAAEDLVHADTPKGRLAGRVLRYSLRRADGVVAVSHYVKRTLVDALSQSADHIRVIHNAIDVDAYDSANALAKADEPPRRLLYIGRLGAEKGVDNILRALVRIPKTLYDRFTIVGDGLERGRLERLAAELGLQDKTAFVGKTTNVPEWLGKSDLFLHVPNWEEAFGLTIVEAMAAGLIVVCGNRGGIPEIVEHRVNGFLVEDNQIDTLVSILTTILTNDEAVDLPAIRRGALETAQRFRMEVYAEKLDRFLWECRNQKGSSA